MKRIPRVVQLPGGVRLDGIAFRCVEYNADGSPKTFELLPSNSEATGKGIWVLFAHEESIRAPVPEDRR